MGLLWMAVKDGLPQYLTKRGVSDFLCGWVEIGNTVLVIDEDHSLFHRGKNLF